MEGMEAPPNRRDHPKREETKQHHVKGEENNAKEGGDQAAPPNRRRGKRTTTHWRGWKAAPPNRRDHPKREETKQHQVKGEENNAKEGPCGGCIKQTRVEAAAVRGRVFPHWGDTHMLPFPVSIWFRELGQDLWITRSRGKLYISRVAKNSTLSSRPLKRLHVSKVATNSTKTSKPL